MFLVIHFQFISFDKENVPNSVILSLKVIYFGSGKKARPFCSCFQEEEEEIVTLQENTKKYELK